VRTAQKTEKIAGTRVAVVTASISTGNGFHFSTMRHTVLAALVLLPLVAGCVKADPATDSGNSLSSLPTSPSSSTGTGTTGSSGATGTTGSTGTTGATSTALAYNQDIKPLMQSDCVVCHNTTFADAGVRLSTYAQVMTTVRAGSASSLLVAATQSNGSMYRYWSGSTATRQAKAAQVRSWVVTYNAQENR